MSSPTVSLEFLVIDSALLGIFNALETRPAALTDERIVVHGEGGDPGAHRWHDLVAKGTSGYAPPWSVTADDLMNIQYTSGTTGFPEGACSHSSTGSQWAAWQPTGMGWS